MDVNLISDLNFILKEDLFAIDLNSFFEFH